MLVDEGELEVVVLAVETGALVVATEELDVEVGVVVDVVFVEVVAT